MKNQVVVFALVGVLAGAVRSEVASWSQRLAVEKGTPVSLGTDYKDLIATNVVAHDDLTVGVGGNFNVYPLAADGKVTSDYIANIALGPDIGDYAVLEVNNSSLLNTESNGYDTSGKKIGAAFRGDIQIGQNGGNGLLRLGNDESSGYIGAAYVRNLQLNAAAQTDAEVFDSAEIHYNSYLAFSSVYNYNDKPLRIRVTNPNRARNDISGGRFMIRADSKAFRPYGNGNIILEGDAKAPIIFRTWSDWGYKLFGDSPKAKLQFEGVDVIFEVAANSDVLLNSANVVWNNTGDMIITRFGTATTSKSFIVQAANALPYGPQTGNVVVRPNATSKVALTLDIYGKSQRVNGLVLEGGSKLVSSSAAEIAFGYDDADGLASGDLAADNVNYVKGGSGSLMLSNATLTALCVTGGTLRVAAGTANRIGTLAITNATVVVAPGESLEVSTWLMGENVERITALPTGGMSNVVSVVDSLEDWMTLVKDGPEYLTATLPDDANGAGLHVKGGVLRLGGEVCSNSYWRFIAKKAKANVGNYRDIARGKTYNLQNADGSDHYVYVPVGLGTIGLFTRKGLASQGKFEAQAADDAASLPEGYVTATTGFIDGWNLDFIQQHINANQTKDPILAGGKSGNGRHFVHMHDTWLTENKYDVNASGGSGSWIPDWSGGILYTNDFEQLDPEVSSTWKTVSWRWKSEWAGEATSYSLRRIVNNDAISVTDWELQSSPDGQANTWVTMDCRSNQTYATEAQCGLNPLFCYTYNSHVPYLFESRNANWRFSTFGAVEIDRGATLDLNSLRNENIAVSALKVDLTAGAGTITKFIPAGNGELWLVNPRAEDVVDGHVARRIVVPLTIQAIGNAERLGGWKIYLDGCLLHRSHLNVRNGCLTVVTPQGMMVIFR